VCTEVAIIPLVQTKASNPNRNHSWDCQASQPANTQLAAPLSALVELANRVPGTLCGHSQMNHALGSLSKQVLAAQQTTSAALRRPPPNAERGEPAAQRLTRIPRLHQIPGRVAPSISAELRSSDLRAEPTIAASASESVKY